METQGSWQRSLWDFTFFVLAVFGFFLTAAGVVVSAKPAVVCGFIAAAIALLYFNLKDE